MEDLHVHFHIPDRFLDLLERMVIPHREIAEILHKLDHIQETLNKMPTQADFDAQVASINDSITTLTTAVAAEAAQVQAFIDSHPDLDTSALDTVKSNLDALSTSVDQIDPQVPVPPAP